MSYSRYPKYKDSGVEWLGKVPEHWGVKRLKHVASLNMGQSPSSEDCNQEGEGLPFLQGTADFGIVYPLPKHYCPVPNKLAQKNDILFSVRAPVGEINEADQVYGMGRGLCAITPNIGNSNRYIFYGLHIIKEELLAVATGSTYEAVSVEQIRNSRCLLPLFEEQTAISSFLDRETSRIDTLISEKEHLISLLQEYRQALISHAVTKGLDPNVKMKDSGVEWIGDVPEGWDLRRLKDVGTLFSGAGFPHEHQNVQGEELYFYKVGDLSLSENGKTLLDSPHTISREVAKTLRAAVIPKDAIVYAKIGAALILNRRRMTTADCCIDNNMTAYVTNQQRVLPDWAFRWLSAIDFGEHVNPGAVPSLSEGYQSSFPIPVPPIIEQTAIATFLDQETTRIDTLISEARKFIDLLKEYRSSLITAAVTGKIDVREVVHSGSKKREIAHE